MKRIASLVAALFVLSACGNSDDKGTPTTTVATTATSSPPATTPAAPDPANAKVKLTELAVLNEPLALATRKGDPALYIVERDGRVRAIRDGKLVDAPVLDISGQVSTDGERGLLGIAFANSEPLMYLNYTDLDGHTHIVEYRIADGVADPASRRELLFQEQPYSNHNGGGLAIAADGTLFIGLGDGGSGSDPHGNGQNMGVWLGKMLRIDPKPSGEQPYTVPPDNPFVGQPGVRPEIWALGLRNPWRFTIDPQTADVWIGDVGQNRFEEINYSPAGTKGHNFGWSLREGAHEFKDTPAGPGALVNPIHEYTHDGDVCSVTGGVVYRGKKIPQLYGAYLFGDLCVGDVNALVHEAGTVKDVVKLPLHTETLVAFGQDQAGEVYLMSFNGGRVYRIDPA